MVADEIGQVAERRFAIPDEVLWEAAAAAVKAVARKMLPIGGWAQMNEEARAKALGYGQEATVAVLDALGLEQVGWYRCDEHVEGWRFLYQGEAHCYEPVYRLGGGS